jgi:SAM-dependent methyltransferase
MVRPQDEPFYAAQQRSWQVREKLRGCYDCPSTVVQSLPNEPAVRAQLDWLRGVWRRRGRCRLLELGAGRGWASRALAEDGHEVIATDLLDDPHIGLGCAAQQGTLLGCVRAGAERLPFRPQVFDGVFSFATLQHLVDLEKVFQEIARVLRPGGLFVALQEPLRGGLTTQGQRLQNSFSYLQARWWLVGELPGTPPAEVLHVRQQLGFTLFEVSRRAASLAALGAAVGWNTTALPLAVVLNSGHDLQPLAQWNWLEAFAAAFALDGGQLRADLHRANATCSSAELLAYWIHLGNGESVFWAHKSDPALPPPPPTEQLRRLDGFLLGRARHGFVPIHGIYPAEGNPQQPYFWLQPEAGLLLPVTRSVALTLSCPPQPYCVGPVRFEVRCEEERQPRCVLLLQPGKTTSVQVPLPVVGERPSLFLRLTANFGFIPSDFHPGQSQDTRLLSYQLRDIRI